MSTTNQTVVQGSHILVTVNDRAADGVTLDTTEQLIIGGVSAAVSVTVGRLTDLSDLSSFVADPAGRVLKIAGLIVGSSPITVSAPGVPSDKVLTINTTVTPAPNNSTIEFVSVAGPFAGT